MLLCKGKQCRYKKTCQLYVLGLGRTQCDGCEDQWINHCLHTSKYVKVEQPPKKSDYPRGC